MTESLFATEVSGVRESSARISPCGKYRYSLTRRWGRTTEPLLWVMCNPSTADASIDDPTIRKCIGFSTVMGFDALTVVNLYALRATNPRALRAHRDGVDVVGPQNDDAIRFEATLCRTAMCAWGDAAAHGPDRVAAAMRLLAGTPTWCFGRTAAGRPRHPLMLAYATKREAYT